MLFIAATLACKNYVMDISKQAKTQKQNFIGTNRYGTRVGGLGRP